NEIISIFTEKENSVVDSDEEEPINSPEVEKLTHQNAKKYFETLITYMEQQEEITQSDIFLLRRWREDAAKRERNSGKQSKITDFLKKVNKN
ncbi:hypothetical protein HZS_7627, partial [Henneguya salminicola]